MIALGTMLRCLPNFFHSISQYNILPLHGFQIDRRIIERSKTIRKFMERINISICLKVVDGPKQIHPAHLARLTWTECHRLN